MNIKSQIMLVMSLVTIITATLFYCITYKTTKSAFIEGMNAGLLAESRHTPTTTDSSTSKNVVTAATNTADIDKMLRKTMLLPLLLAFAILLAGMGTSFVLAGSLSKPIVQLTAIAREIATGNFDQEIECAGNGEISSLSQSIKSMSAAIKNKIASIGESEERFRRIFNEGLIGIVIVALDKKIMKANPAFCRIVGYAQEELSTMTLADITHPDYVTRDSEHLKKVASGELPYYKTEKQYIRKDGSPIWASVLASSIHNESGKPLYFLAMIDDISDRKTMEDRLSRSEERFRSLFENMTEGVVLHEVVYRPDGTAVDYRMVDINPAYTEHTGIPAGKIRGQLASAFYGTETPPYMDIFVPVAETGKPYHFEMFFAPLKRYFNVAVCSPRKGWFALVFEDITSRKQMDEQLRQNEEKFRTLFENMTEGVALHEMIYDEKGRAVNYRIMDVNPAYQKQTGITPEMARGKLATELYATESAPYLPVWARVAETGKPHCSEVFFGPMKRTFSIATFSPRKGWFATVFTDITDKKQTEERLLQSEEKFRALVETTSDWIWEVDRNGMFTYVSPRVRELLGYEPDELLGRTPASLMPHDEAQRVDAIIKQRLVSHEPFIHFENINLHKKGHPVVLETAGVPAYDANGRFTGFRGIDRDVTERNKATEAIHQLNRELEQRVKDRTMQLELANMELRTFAYSVSHDLRAPLRSIDGFSKAILEDYSDKLDMEGRDYLNRLRRASQRMAALIDDLLKLSRVTSGEMRVTAVNLSQIAENTLADLHETDRQRSVEVVVLPDLKTIADPQLMTVALENLLGNAWKFTSRKPDAKIEFGMKKQDSTSVYYVRDNGAGFDMTFVDKLFGAFQRLHTSEDYPGDGIGLASVQRIIHRHGGRVWAEGKPNEGATFYFTLG